ncbi:hypothetical protein OSTOST_22001, partial [Ostertagia ostertagi]
MDKTAFRTISIHEFKTWSKKFGCGDDLQEDKERAGRPSLVDHKGLIEAVERDRHQPLREIDKNVGVFP